MLTITTEQYLRGTPIFYYTERRLPIMCFAVQSAVEDVEVLADVSVSYTCGLQTITHPIQSGMLFGNECKDIEIQWLTVKEHRSYYMCEYGGEKKIRARILTLTIGSNIQPFLLCNMDSRFNRRIIDKQMMLHGGVVCTESRAETRSKKRKAEASESATAAAAKIELTPAAVVEYKTGTVIKMKPSDKLVYEFQQRYSAEEEHDVLLSKILDACCSTLHTQVLSTLLTVDLRANPTIVFTDTHTGIYGDRLHLEKDVAATNRKANAELRSLLFSTRLKAQEGMKREKSLTLIMTQPHHLAGYAPITFAPYLYLCYEARQTLLEFQTQLRAHAAEIGLVFTICGRALDTNGIAPIYGLEDG